MFNHHMPLALIEYIRYSRQYCIFPPSTTSNLSFGACADPRSAHPPQHPSKRRTAPSSEQLLGQELSNTFIVGTEDLDRVDLITVS